MILILSRKPDKITYFQFVITEQFLTSLNLQNLKTKFKNNNYKSVKCTLSFHQVLNGQQSECGSIY